ncbi:MAG: hypothetical protein R3C11_25980 [Planctomycetaceae bacterium]
MNIFNKVFGGGGQKNKPTSSDESGYNVAEVYSGLRNQVLTTEFDSSESAGNVIHGVMMETGYENAVVTLVAIADGTISLYFSSGGGVIGAGAHQPVEEVGKQFRHLATKFMSAMTKTETYPLPTPGNVRFYVLTNRGVYTLEAVEQDLGHHRHECSPLFHKAHHLIAMIREHSPE